jgi:hypothetical protein
MHEAYRPVSLIAALWPTQDFQFPAEVEELGGRLRGQFALFTEQRVGVPAGGPIQPEWPRLVLLGDQHHWALELAPGKISLRRAVNHEARLDEVLEAHRATLAPLHSWLAENLDFRVYRIGLVIQLFCNTRSSANEKISQYFLHPRALQGQAPYDVQLGILSKVNLYHNVVVNRWLRVRPLRSIDPRHVDFAAQVEVDLNTRPEDTQIKTVRELNDFFAAAGRHLNEEIPLLEDGEFME